MHTNRLIHEKSPYLLQHAHNPVDWHPWGEEAFNMAKAEDKPIFLSIGYSTCHWCHVMERESFESAEIAEVLNRSFVPIKVDREERPDIDRIYMTFVQASTGSGGWPMSVWLTPDLKPIFGGTYFPPDSRYGRPGFRSVLEQLAAAWRNERSRIVRSGDEILQQLQDYVRVDRSGQVNDAVLDSAFFQFRRGFDSRLGGFGGAPKFPRPVVHNFLLRYAYLKGSDEARDMVLLTLREMAKGGMNDQLGGGFHRYSVDARWFVPHFEKMLYDQAQLAISYVEAYQVTGDRQYASVARDILEYVLRDMTHVDGGFFSAEDADSVINPEDPHEKGEGAFYIWSFDELRRILGEEHATWFSYRFGCEPDGNVREDPHGEFLGRNILYQRHTTAETAAQFGIDEAEASAVLTSAGAKLMETRSARVRPHLDDKILAGWNGLMISAFAKAGQALEETRYVEAAERAARFVLEHMRREDTLLRRWRDGDASIPAFLDDYAFLSNALLDLYEATFEESWVSEARALLATMRERFEDTENGGFYSTTDTDPSVVMRIKEDYDGAEPSGNSYAILALLRLARMTGDEGVQQSADRALEAFAGKMNDVPSGLPQMLVAFMYSRSAPRQIVLAGEKRALEPMLAEVHRVFLPFHTLMWNGSAAVNSELANMGSPDAPATAFVCENFTCQLPVTEPRKLAELLK